MTSDINLYRELYTLENDIRNRLANEKFMRLSMEDKYREVFKPITDTTYATTFLNQGIQDNNIMNLIEKSTNLDTKNWLDFKNNYVSYPDIIRSINALRTNLGVNLTEILNELKTGNTNVQDALAKYEISQAGFSNLVKELYDRPRAVEAIDNIEKYGDDDIYIESLSEMDREAVDKYMQITRDSGYEGSQASATEEQQQYEDWQIRQRSMG